MIDTLRQIKSGLWAIEPNYGLSLKETVENIFSKDFNEAHKKENLEARHYLLDENSKKYNSNDLSNVSEGSIGVIHITGTMIKYGNYYCWGTDELVEKAYQFDNNPNIIGQIWRIDTGGGAVNSVAPYLSFLKNKNKPVLSLCDMCGSAGYWTSVGTDFIMAENTISSMFGSIGVLASFRDASKYWKDLGVIDHTILADQSEHKNKAFHLALEGDYEKIKNEILNPVAIKFQENVKSFRPNLKLDVEGIISGKMFYAQEALEIGLIDGIGDFNHAVEKLTTLAIGKSI